MWTPILALAVALGRAEPPAYPGVADPMAFVAARYGEYQHGNRTIALDSYASTRLRRLLHAFDEAAGGEELDGADFWIDGVDWRLAGLDLALEPRRRPDRQTVTARFRNLSRPVLLRFHFVREGGRWFLDEVVRPGRRGWTLTGRLARRPRGRPNP
ncbi:MAG TPA: hypothetical protein VEC11_14815 [Allosphingosinicella sp.]|nr:hypothetical protein [Allosphingosinicella sp.]